ncbi:alpha/beta-type small acid-soluble spore protein [Brevibacillus fulvus]|uniref:Alpha/beta hydrolase n=1 Tax=Brevibacillus fulvus TaxID=1125967 RepID=A0A938XRG5_9BACL|nr:alpha/beta-type small acid-soluble spore protein [Brevibacillus fulvus]MBM7588472.1 hypothetical protein [Brevibacillus fulvus]
MGRRRRPLVADAQDGLDLLKARLQNVLEPEQAKFQVADQLHIPLKEGDNGDLAARDAGRIGGRLGGSMVKEMIRSAQQQLLQRQTDRGR